MNSSQIESSDSTSQDRIDFERFQGIWNNIKKVKQSSVHSNQGQKDSSQRKSIVSVKKAIEQQQQKNIETRLVLTQKQLKKAKQNTNLLLKKLSQAEQQIQYLEYELEKQIKQKEQILEEVQQLRQNYVKKQRQRTSQLEKSTLRENQTGSDVQKLTKNLQFKERQVDKLTLKIKSLEMTIKNLQGEVKVLNQNSKVYMKKLQENQKSLLSNEQNSFRTMKGAQILELEQAYNTIERLMLLLRNTEEFKNFSSVFEDIRNSHFLKNIEQRKRKNELIPKFTKKSCSCMDVKIDEKLLWTPTACYKKVLELKIKYGSLTEECIEELLFELNRIYKSREEECVKKVEQSYESKLSQMRKKSQVKYDELVARKQIQRLKKQVLTQRYSKSKSSKNPQLGDNLQILKAIGQYEDQLKLKEKQTLLLKERIRLMQSENTSYDKILYLEGTLWILDKVLLEIQANSQDLQLFQTKFRERIDSQMSHEDWTNSFKYFFQNITQTQNNLTEKLLMMKQSTIKKMGTQKDPRQSTINFQNDASFGI